jgi:hypothetical protein
MTGFYNLIILNLTVWYLYVYDYLYSYICLHVYVYINIHIYTQNTYLHTNTFIQSPQDLSNNFARPAVSKAAMYS